MIALLLVAEVLAAFASDDADRVDFVAVGDWGAPLTSTRQRRGQRSVADGLASWLESISHEENNVDDNSNRNSPFILSLGDNFYPSGVKDMVDMETRFTESFEDVYNHDVFAGVPWYVVAGNKDHEGDVSAQIQFSGYPRWNFPDYFHRVVREFKGGTDSEGTMKVEIIAIDTVQLADPSNNSERFQWVENNLSQSDADYLIVAGHFPASQIQGLEKLLQKYKVSAYIAGHLHCQQHKSKGGVDYFISGAGMELDCNNYTIDPEDAKGGFLSFEATSEKMVVTFHDQSGNQIHNTEINSRSTYKNGKSAPQPLVNIA